MKDLFTKQLKRKMATQTLPPQFDKNFYQKLELLKQQEKQKEQQQMIQEPKTRSSLYDQLLSLIAPLSFATTLCIMIVLGTTFNGNSPDWVAQTQVIQEIQKQEVFELSTLSDSEWDALISAAN